jgi:hypothetical protein
VKFYRHFSYTPSFRYKLSLCGLFLQREFRRVADRDLLLHLGKNVKLKLAKSCAITSVFITLLLLWHWNFSWWQIIIFAYCILLNTLLNDFWVLTSRAFILTADGIEKALTEVRVLNVPCAQAPQHE